MSDKIQTEIIPRACIIAALQVELENCNYYGINKSLIIVVTVFSPIK